MAGRLVLRKTIAAAPREVYSFWTDAESMKSWMCPCDVTEARARLDARVGGSFEIVMKGPGGDLVHTGTYRVVDPPRKLVFTWISPATRGQPTLVTVEFLARGRGTEVVLTHEDLPDEAAVASHGIGWTSILDRLAPRAEAAAVSIEPFGAADWLVIKSIYEEGIATGMATFETEPPAWEKWDAAHLPEPRLKAAPPGAVAGWAALSPVSSRCVYAGVAEVSIYMAGAYRGRGIGSRLLGELVRASEDRGLWSLQAGIFAANTPSLKLHAACGFRVVGTRERLGQLGGVWRDVVLMERRSPRVG